MTKPALNRHFLVLAMREPHFDPAVIQPHLDWLADLRRQGRVHMAGGFSDRSGGAYVLLAGDQVEAQHLADADPLHQAGVSRLSVFEWDV